MRRVPDAWAINFDDASRSVRHRLIRWLPRWYAVPVISPTLERLRLAAVGEHVCQPFRGRP